MGVADKVEQFAKRVPFLRRPFYQRDIALLERDEFAARLDALGPTLSGPAPVQPIFADTRRELRSLSAWNALLSEKAAIFECAHTESIVSHGLRHGVVSAFLGRIAPSEMQARDTNYREGFLARGFNPRQRALLDLLHELAGHRSIYELSIYAHEAFTPFALILRGRYPRFLGSEYAPSEADRKRIFPVPSIDITASDLPDSSFDFVLSGDVLEHVPDLYAALCDTARILKPGGHLIASVPFAYSSEETVIRARLVDGEIEHLAPPEYHGNPMDPAGGSLVFQIPGWAVLADARKAGFRDAYVLFWSSAEHGYAGFATLPGVLVLVATK